MRAGREATRLHHVFIGPHHVVLALYRGPVSPAREALVSVGPTVDEYEAAVLQKLSGSKEPADKRMRWAPAFMTMRAVAIAFAAVYGRDAPSDEDTLLALLYADVWAIGVIGDEAVDQIFDALAERWDQVPLVRPPRYERMEDRTLTEVPPALERELVGVLKERFAMPGATPWAIYTDRHGRRVVLHEGFIDVAEILGEVTRRHGGAV